MAKRTRDGFIRHWCLSQKGMVFSVSYELAPSIYSAMDERFEEILIFNKPALFTCMRIDRRSVPQGYYQYEVRHDDIEGWGYAVQLAKSIKLNLFGTVIINEKIGLPPGGYLNLSPEDIYFYEYGDGLGMKEYMEKYPPTEKPPKNRDHTNR